MLWLVEDRKGACSDRGHAHDRCRSHKDSAPSFLDDCKGDCRVDRDDQKPFGVDTTPTSRLNEKRIISLRIADGIPELARYPESGPFKRSPKERGKKHCHRPPFPDGKRESQCKQCREETDN